MVKGTITVSDLEIMSNAFNYRQWIYHHISSHIGNRILEVGGGIGNFTELLLNRELVVSIDIFRPCVEYMQGRFRHLSNVIPLQLDIGQPGVRGLKHLVFDTVVCLNVLEHVEQDVEALCTMSYLLQPGGRLLLLVPAYQWLYGTVDKSLKHFRRYSRTDLIEKLEQSNLEVEFLFYMNSIGVLAWFLNNKVILRQEESRGQILFFDRFIAPWLSKLESYIPPPFGLSLVSIARKSQTVRSP